MSPNRIIALDTETTGLQPEAGHRIIEIGLVEITNTHIGNQLCMRINPQRAIDPAAQAVHGISIEQLRDKPTFGDIAHSLLEWINGADLVIHNAPFDTGFIDAELARMGPQWGKISNYCNIICTRQLAREKLPDWELRHSLDNLCDYYGIDRSSRTHHGALLDAQLLADVFLQLTAEQVAA